MINNNTSTIAFRTDKGNYSFKSEELVPYIEKQFCQDKKSFLLIPIPNTNDFIPSDVIKQIDSETVQKQLDLVEQTIPDQSNNLSDFHYTFDAMPEWAQDQPLQMFTNDKAGLFVNDIDGGKFHFVSQRHYDALGDFVLKYIQEELLIKRLGLEEHWLPLDSSDSKDKLVNIFMSKDALTNPDKLMVLIQGSGAVRPGQWARALCMNDSLKTGTQYNYIVQAMQQGYGVIVLNPNHNYYIESSLDDPNKYTKEGYLNRNKPEPLSKLARKSIKHNDSPPAHTTYVWDNFINKSVAKDIVIVAHSAGGWCTMELLKSRTTETLNRVRGIAFTDSVHSVYSSDPKLVRDFIVDNAINWVTSDKPCDQLVSNKRAGSSCECRSAGHNKHEFTSEFCRDAAFSFLNSKLSQ